ncbi:MAG: hypothetical protein SVR08_14740, partial [Spirochaetota bacterium]|nr:hypothetical protein [Spirochaetota bacterium]
MSSTITILGSTGSIGVTTLRVLKSLKDEFKVYGLSYENPLCCALLRRITTAQGPPMFEKPSGRQEWREAG